MRRFRILTGLILLFFSCDDNQFPEQPEPPVAQFFMAGQIHADQVSLTAGEEDYFMFTDYTNDENEERFVYQGRLSKLFCINCGNALNIEILDSVRRPATYTFGEEVPLTAKELPFKTTVEGPGVQFKFSSSVDTAEAESYFWDFGDGVQSTLNAPRHIYESNPQQSMVNVTHRVIRKSLCAAEVQRSLDVLGTQNADSCQIDFTITEDRQDTIFVAYTLTPLVEDFGQRFYRWEIFVDGSNEAFKISNEGIYTFELFREQVIDKIVFLTEDIECTGEVVKFFDKTSGGPGQQDTTSICDLSFQSQQQFILAPAPELTSEVCISWVNSEGLEYRSDRFVQPERSSFTITSVEPFEENDRGQKTLKLGITFSCELVNEQGETLWVEDMSGIFGVAFP